jgi:putative hydrolase of the HAD superfamily
MFAEMIQWGVVKHLLLDLDDTLYPASARIGAESVRRMIRFVADFLGVSFEEARVLRDSRKRRYGTTLEWLQAEHGMGGADRDEKALRYMHYVHPPEEVGEVDFDPRLRPFLQGLRLPMTVLTNAPLFHAERILRFLQVDDLFLGVWDVMRSGFMGKPHKNAYIGALSISGYSIEETLFADDYGQYVQGYLDLGGGAVLVSDKETEMAKAPAAPHIGSIYEIGNFL